MTRFDLVVIGSGPAGQRAAVQAAKLGKRVALVERSREMGGVCVNAGTIPSKTLREAVLDLSGLRQRSMYGDSHRGKRVVSAKDLLRRASLIMHREREVIRSQLLRNRVTLCDGTARFEDPHRIAVANRHGVRHLDCDFVVIASGSVPALPSGIAVDHRIILTSDDILAVGRLPETLAVVGAGIVGTEYATMFAAVGVKVTLIDKRPELLEMVDREVVNTLIHQANRLGVTLRLGEDVRGVERDPDGALVMLGSGKLVAADMVLISAGRQGATAELALERAGLDADARGRIAVNAHGQHHVSHIYAAGDVVGAPALASTSSEQGRLAACHAFDVPTSSTPELFPFGIHAIPEVAWVGATESDLTTRGVPYVTGVARYREIARGQILSDLDGMLKLIVSIEDRRLLGVWGIGTQATELVHVGQAVMTLGGTLDYFVSNVFNYPTLAECYKVAALDAWNTLRRLERHHARRDETRQAA